MLDNRSGSLSNSVASGSHSTSSQFTKPRQALNPDSYNVRILAQARQQTCLALTADYSLLTDVCCISAIRIQHLNSVIQLTAPSVPSRYFTRTSADEATA